MARQATVLKVAPPVSFSTYGCGFDGCWWVWHTEMTALLTTVNGVPLEGKVVGMSADNGAMCDSRTNTAGVATCLSNWDNGIATTATARFDGDSSYQPAQGQS